MIVPLRQMSDEIYPAQVSDWVMIYKVNQLPEQQIMQSANLGSFFFINAFTFEDIIVSIDRSGS